MGLEKVIREIELSAKKAEQQALDEARREAETILGKARAEAKSVMDSARQKTEREISAMRQRELSALKLKLRRDLLNSRKKVIEQIRTETDSQLEKIPDRKEVLSKLLARAKSELPDAKTVYVSRQDTTLMKGLASKLVVKELPPGQQGIILEDAKGEVSVNHTFGLIMQRIFESRLGKTYAEVFGSA